MIDIYDQRRDISSKIEELTREITENKKKALEYHKQV